MLFRKKMPRSCLYCTHGTSLNESQILCTKRGVVIIREDCRKFAYDPCKRLPPPQKAPELEAFSKDDFTL